MNYPRFPTRLGYQPWTALRSHTWRYADHLSVTKTHRIYKASAKPSYLGNKTLLFSCPLTNVTYSDAPLATFNAPVTAALRAV